MPSDQAKSTSTLPIKQTAYWRRTRQLTVTLLCIWFAITFLTIFFARELSGIMFFGWPFSFYMAAQGTALIYLIIVGIYAWRMQQLGKTFQNKHTDAQ